MPESEKFNEEGEGIEEKTTRIFINETFSEIKKIESESRVSFSHAIKDIEDYPAQLTKNKNGGYTLDIDIKIGSSSETFDLELVIDSRKFLAKNVHVLASGTKFETTQGVRGLVTSYSSCHLRELSCENFNNNEESFHRYVQKAPNSEIKNFITSRPCRNEVSTSFMGMLNLSVNENRISLYEVKHENQKYIIIDSNDKINFDLFADVCYSIMIGYGFLSGNFYQDEAYYIKAEDSKFLSITGISYHQLRPSVITGGNYNPIFAFAIGYTDDPIIQQQYGYFLKIFDEALFSTLCTKIFLDSQYAALLLLVIESNKTSLILKPAGYSVALEKITNIIAEENNGLKPITDKALSRLFTAEIKKVLDQFKDRIEAGGNKDSMVILTKNIYGVNNPTNKDKLTKPFEIYGIHLSEEENLAIGNRNDFLHGRPLEIEEGSDEYIEIYMNCLRLNKLVNKLILKHIGFSGPIVNHLKHNESVFKKTINEDLFEYI